MIVVGFDMILLWFWIDFDRIVVGVDRIVMGVDGILIRCSLDF